MSGRKMRRIIEPPLAVVSPVLYFSVHRFFQERLYWETGSSFRASIHAGGSRKALPNAGGMPPTKLSKKNSSHFDFLRIVVQFKRKLFTFGKHVSLC